MDGIDKILVDGKSQQILKELVRIRQDANLKIQLVLQTILNMNNLTGNYILANDFTTLILQEKKEES